MNYAQIRPSFEHQRDQLRLFHPPSPPQPGIQPNQLKKMQPKMIHNFWQEKMREYWKGLGVGNA